MQPSIHKPSDESLVSLILERQEDWHELLAELLQRYRQTLLTRCYLYLKNRQDAEDAAQETELRVFRAIHGFRQESSFRTWLLAIADRQCHDLARQRARHLLSDHIRDLIEIHEQVLRHRVDSGEAHDLAHRAMARIRGRERDILMLRFYTDLSLRDIADHLGLGLSATKMRLYRALESFGAQLESMRRTV